MSSKKASIRIPHNASVLIGDGRKALFLRNEGTEVAPRLEPERVLISKDNPVTHEQGSDRPGRTSSSRHRSAMEQTDWHDIEEHKFARDIAGALQSLALDKDIPGFVIAAPPRTLASLREHLDERFKRRLIAEVAKDLTGQPLGEIEKHLTTG